LLALGAGAVLIALVSRHVIYPAYSWNRDEIAYLWFKNGLHARHVFFSAGGRPEFYWPWLAGLRDGSFFSQFTPGWPLVMLAADVVFGSPELALAFGTALAVLGTYFFTREVTEDRPLALVSATLMLASPIIAIQSGVYLSYLLSLGLGLFAGAALLAGLRRDSRVLLVGAGALLGGILLTRPFDAVLWAAPLLAYGTVAFWRRRRLTRAIAFVAIGVLPFFVFTLAWSRWVTGSFTTFPATAKDALDTLSFGSRRLMPGTEIVDYTARLAAHSLADNVFALPPFLVGGWLGIGTAAVGLWSVRRNRSARALLLVAAAFLLGSVVSWHSYLSAQSADLSGPVPLIPLYAPICVLVAATILAAWRWRRAVAVGLCGLLAVGTMLPLASSIRVNHRISAAQEPWHHVTRSIDRPAIVFVANAGDYLLHLNPYSVNPPGLNSLVVYALDRGGADLDLISDDLSRVPYLELTSDPAWDDPVKYHDAPSPHVSLIRLSRVSGNVVTLRVAVTNPRDEPAVVTYLQVGDHLEVRTLATDAAKGDTLTTAWTITPADLTTRLGEITVGIGSGATPAAALRGHQEQHRFPYRRAGSGQIEMLYPGRTFVGRPSKLTVDFREVDRLRNLAVELTANL
jgi:hypothetical protein